MGRNITQQRIGDILCRNHIARADFGVLAYLMLYIYYWDTVYKRGTYIESYTDM